MTRLVVGSVAMRYHLSGSREPKDLDVFTNEPMPAETFGGLRVETLWHDSFASLFGSGNRVATLDELFTIKTSHSAWELKNGSWTKHMNDSVRLREAGAVLLPELYAGLYAVWEELHGRKGVDLAKDKTAFFSDAVRRTYDHDSIHRAVAYGDEPLYERFLKPGETVAMDMAKVWASDEATIIQLFREEVLATALERIMIPSDFTASPGRAYLWALRRTITSLTKGRSSLLMALHYEELRSPDPDYVSRFRSRKDRLIIL